MFFTWEICHDTGERKGFLNNRVDGEVTVALNDQCTHTVKASLEESVSSLIRPGRTRMKVRCHILPGDVDVFLLANNLIQQPISSGDYVEIPGVDTSIRLLNASHTPYPESGVAAAEWDASSLDRSEILWELVWRADKRRRQLQDEHDLDMDDVIVPTIGISEGTLAAAGVPEDFKTPDGPITWDVLKDYADRDGWPDFELEPVDNIGDYHVADFNTYSPQRGADRTQEAILEYGHNLSADPDGFQYEPSGVDLCNRVAFIGRGGKVWVAEDTISINRYGIWQGHDQQVNTGDIDKLQALAESFIKKHTFHVNFVNVVPAVEQGGTARGWHRDALGNWTSLGGQEYAAPPIFAPRDKGGDYYLGDTITIRAKDQFTIDVPLDPSIPDTDFHARVMGATYRELDDAGNVGVSLTLVPDIPDDPNVGGYQSAVKVRNG